MQIIAFVIKCASLEETRNLLRELLKKKKQESNRIRPPLVTRSYISLCFNIHTLLVKLERHFLLWKERYLSPAVRPFIVNCIVR